MESKAFETRDLTALARERVSLGPPPDWILPSEYDKTFTTKIRGEATYLLKDTQIQAELGQTYAHRVVRLESQNQVQLRSQWRLGFEPQTQSLILHSIKIRRGDSEMEHAALDRMQFLQREAALERFAIHGSITLLLLLEDVRPGDILDVSYTVIDRPRLMPEYLTAFFELRAGTEIGKYRFLVRHNERRPLKWKSSAAQFTPVITTENGEVCCVWSGEKYAAPEAEGGTPFWHMMFQWIEVSDCPDWQTVAGNFLNVWNKIPSGENVQKLVEEITASSPDLLARVTRAIEIVQDDFRYLSVNLEFGGQVPAAPDTVVRRRYGDCKDLAFLLVQLLRALGVQARPVLVHTVWGKSIGSMLPAPQMFNHVVVEYEIGNEKRWVDGTAKNQGGGALNRHITDFGLGLPIDAATTKLEPVPAASLKAGTYDIKETIILDTTGKTSFLALVITATGVQADSLRHEFANAGIDAIAKNRLQAYANRFSRAARTKALECRDDREANEFVLAEAYEIATPILVHEQGRICLFQVRSDITAGLMIDPGLAKRRHPFALPFPCQRTHTIEVEFAGLGSLSLPMFQAGNKNFTFSRRCRSWPNSIKVTFAVETLKDSIPPDELEEHRKHVQAIWEAAAINLRLPTGYVRNRQPRWDFGALPAANPSRTATGNLVVLKQQPVEPKNDTEIPVTTAEKETIAVQKTAEVAGMPATAKEMPPAREPIPLPADSENPRASQRRPRKLEKRCAFAFFFFLLALVAWVAILPLRLYVSKELAGMDMVFIVMPSWIGSMILGIFGWKQLGRYPGRYTDASKLFATLTFALGGFAGLFLVPTIIAGLCTSFDHTRAQNQQHDAEEIGSLKFKDQNFIFHQPAPPWQHVDAGAYGRYLMFVYKHPDQLIFEFAANKIPPAVTDPRKSIIELSKSTLRKSVAVYEVVSEKEVSHHGLAGWQIETKTSNKGHDYYSVQWLYATNGYGYLLTTLGTPNSKLRIEEEADRMFENFELIPPEHISESLDSPK